MYYSLIIIFLRTAQARLELVSQFLIQTLSGGSEANLFYTKIALTVKFQLLLEHESALRLKLLHT
jgi:hypothetical protein